MNTKIGELGIALLCAWFAAGCGSDDSSGGSSGAGGGGVGGSATGGTGGLGGSSGSGAGGSGATVTYSGKISEITAAGTKPLGDVELCADSHPSVACVTAAPDGTYTFPGLPANAEILLHATKADYLDSLTFMVTTDKDNSAFDGGMVSRVTANLLYGIVGVTYDPAKSSVALYVVTPEVGDAGPTGKMVGFAGATASLTPSSGTGPIYSSDTGLPDKAAQQTSKSGVALFAGVDVGDLTATVQATGKTCKLGAYGWPTADATARGLTKADSASFFQAICE